MLIWFLSMLIVVYSGYHVAYIFFQRKFIFRPQKLPSDFKFTCHAPLKEINLRSEDGENLNAVFISQDPGKEIILYFHGNMHHLQQYLPYTIKFTELGYSILMPDYRGFGKSTGELTEKKFYEDALLMYDWLKKSFPDQRIIVYGRSLGTGAGAYVAAHRDCTQLILEAPYYNMYDVSRSYGLMLPTGKYLPFGLRTDLLLKEVKCPITIIHGMADTIVPLSSSKKLKWLLKKGDQFFEIQKGTHNNMEQLPDYHQAMENVIGRKD